MPGRWGIVAALFTVVFAISNPFAAFGVFLPVLAETLGQGRGAISVALSVNLVVGGAAGFAVGAIADRFGPRAILLVTVALTGAGFALAGTARTLWQLYLYVGVMGGLGMSAFYVLSAATVARWFPSGRGLALGLVLTGFNLGFITGGPLAARLIAALGWRPAYAILGAGCGAIGLLAALAVRYPPAPPRPVAPVTAHAAPRPRDPTLREALGDARLWVFGGGWLFLGSVFTLVSVHVVPLARDLGVRLESAALVLTAYGAGAVAGRIGFGVAADRVGTVAALRVCCLLQVVALGALLWAPSLAWLLALMVGFGLGFAGGDTVVVKLIPDLFGVRALGAIMGVFNVGWRVGAAAGPAVAGFIHDATGSYALPFGAAPLAVLASLLLFTIAARHPGRRRTTTA